MDCNRLLRFVILSALSVALLPAQQAQPKGRIITIPGRGIYYDDPSGMISLPSTVTMPFSQGDIKEFLSIGRTKSFIEVPGPSAALAIPNQRPTFYVSGYAAGTRLYLVRSTEKQDYRLIPMKYSGNFSEWASVPKEYLTDLEVQALAPGLLSVTPRSDLKPGEYVILTAINNEYRAIQLCFEFSVQAPASLPPITN